MGSTRYVAAVSLLLLAGTASAQQPSPPPSPQRPAPTPEPADESIDRMKKLAFLSGHWKGEAWILMGKEKSWAVQREWVAPKAGGKVLLIEGLGKEKLADGGEGKVVHEALAVVSWDAEKKAYRFEPYVAGRPNVSGALEVLGENRIAWGYTTERGRVRFTISLTPEGAWHEVGEATRDGQSWVKFFEMTLQKQ